MEEESESLLGAGHQQRVYGECGDNQEEDGHEDIGEFLDAFLHAAADDGEVDSQED